MTEVLDRMDALYAQMESAKSSTQRKQLYEWMENLMRQHPFLSKFWEIRAWAKKYTEKIVRKVGYAIKRMVETLSPSCRIEWNGIEPSNAKQQFYIVELLDRNGDLIWSKVGTTTKFTVERMKEHLSYYKKDGVRYLNVKRLWDCGNTPAEMFESQFRAAYIKKYPGTFRKNDRFTGVVLDYDEADRLFSEFSNS